MSKGSEEEERKLRECMLCQAKAHWRRMQATFLDMADQEAAGRAGTAAEKEDVRTGRQYGHYVYKCVTCVAKEANCSIDDAARMIKQPRREKDLARAREYTAAKNHVLAVRKFLEVRGLDDDESSDSAQSSGAMAVSTESVRLSKSASEGDWNLVDMDNKAGQKKSKRQLKKEMRKLAHMQISKVADIFSPILHLLTLKETDQKAAVDAAQRFQEWLSKSNRLALDEDLEEGDILEEDFEEKLAVQRSFQSCEDPAAMRRAADYSDEWFRTTKGGFRVYYFCAAGGAVYPCFTLTLSDMWDRLHAAMDATSQRWYCPACKTRYKTKYGVLCEMFGSDPSIA